jgi:hypothetical protein
MLRCKMRSNSSASLVAQRVIASAAARLSHPSLDGAVPTTTPAAVAKRTHGGSGSVIQRNALHNALCCCNAQSSMLARTPSYAMSWHARGVLIPYFDILFVMYCCMEECICGLVG